MMRTATRVCLLGALLMVAGCTVRETPAPALTGPSELGLRIALQVTPDSILQDGASQASLLIDVTGPDGRPVRGLPLRIEVLFDGIVQDFGTISAKTVVTDDAGKARAIYTAPPRPANAVNEANVVEFRVTPIGNDFTGETSRSVALRLVTPGVLGPPNAAPVPDFTFSPETPQALTPVVFDASPTTDEGSACGAVCTYSWDFGDGTTGSGVFVTHPFQRAGTYSVRLTVTDPRGASASRSRAVVVGSTPPPTANFTFSPTTPSAGQTIFFNGSPSTAASGRQIVSYEWDFGSGRFASGVNVSKSYDSPGTYQVTLTVTDDAGATNVTTRAVTVTPRVPPPPGTPPTSDFTFSPTTPRVNQTVFFNGTGSTSPSGTTITSYLWDFGDGTTATGSTTSHAYSTPATYVVRLTVTNSAGLTGTSTRNVTVSSP